MHPTQPVENFGNFSVRHLVCWPSTDIHGKFYGGRRRARGETPPSGERLSPDGGVPLRGDGRGKRKTSTVAKYSDFRPIEGYISETVQDRR